MARSLKKGPYVFDRLLKKVQNLNKENKMTIIMATHDLEEINEIKPRIISLAKTVKYDGDLEGWKGF